MSSFSSGPSDSKDSKPGKAPKVWEDVSTTFTEFGALSSEKRQGGNFLSRLWRRNKGEDESPTRVTEAVVTSGLLEHESKGDDDDRAKEACGDATPISAASSCTNLAPQNSSNTDPSDNSSKDDISEGSVGTVPQRDLTSVLSRLGSILDQRSTTPQTYKDSDFKQYWMPDRSCRECYDCGDKFTTFRRRHHCRICGQIFCSKCCNQELPGKIIGYKGGIRVCTYCCDVVQRYAQQSSTTGDMHALEDLRAMSQQIHESGNFDFGSGSSLSPRLSTVVEDVSPQFSFGAILPNRYCPCTPTDSRTLPRSRSALFLKFPSFDHNPVMEESLPELPGRSTPEVGMPFDLTPQSEFSTVESLLLERQLLIQDSVQLRELWCQICDGEFGVEIQTLRIRLRTYQNCIVGKELVDWLIKKDKAATRVQAIGIGQALIHAGYMECVGSQPPIFKDDFTLYRQGEQTWAAMNRQSGNQTVNSDTEGYDKTEPLWLTEIQREDDEDGDADDENEMAAIAAESSFFPSMDRDCHRSNSSESESRRLYYLGETSHSGNFSEVPKLALMSRDLTEEPLPRQDPSVSGLGDDFLKGALFLGKAPMPSSDVVTCPHGWRIVEQLREENGEKLAYTRLKKAHSELWQALIRQMLSQSGLLLGWESVITSCITQVSHFVRPDVRLEGDDMDIRNYVHIKKIPGGAKSDTSLFHGVIFTKNIAHKKMKTRVTNPLILLLRGTIEFQRVEQKFSSLEPQILQEREFMHNCVMKMIAYRPSVIVVEKSVSRLAQEFLLKCGITLLYNVKLSVMERLARFTQADIVPSIDGLVSKPKMGFCHDFRCQSYTLPNKEIKTLAVFDGCATHLGCTIVLSGGTIHELRWVKQILKFMIYTAYNSLLELCFCMDEFGMPKPTGDELPSFHSPVGSLTLSDSLACSQYNRTIGIDELSNLAPKAEEDTNQLLRTSRSGSVISCTGSDKECKENSIMDKRDKHSPDGGEGEYKEQEARTESNTGQRILTDELHAPSENSSVRTASIEDLTSVDYKHSPAFLRVRHSSGVSFSSESFQEDMSGRSTPDIIFTDQKSVQDGDYWDGNSKIVNGILCVIPKTEAELSKSRHPSMSDNQRPSVVLNLTSDQKDLEESSRFAESLDYTIIQTPEVRNTKYSSSSSVSANQDDPLPKKNLAAQIPLPPPALIKSPKSSTSELTELTDFSDPLLSYQNTKDESIFHHSHLPLKEIKQSNYKRFRKALHGVHLSVSPYHKYSIPFIETDKGQSCNSRRYLPKKIYWSCLFDGEEEQMMCKGSAKGAEQDVLTMKAENIEILTAHHFLTCDLTQTIWDKDMQTILADFRARGGRIRVVNEPGKHRHLQFPSQDNMPVKERKEDAELTDTITSSSNDTTTGLFWEKRVDCLDPINHQRLMVLFSSYSFKSSNHPHPCVYPWVVIMDFYGRNDITLGGFLERFCFRKQYLCPSSTCDIPMTDHIRRFVHGNACINVLLKKLDNEVPGGKENILMWSWCRKCKQVTPVVPISADTWSLSFAKYLDLRFHSSSFLRRASAEPCQHSLHHEHYQYFGHRDIVASFKYSSISLRELSLPCPMLFIKPPVFDSLALSNTVRKITNRATERYSQICESTMKLKQEVTSEAQTRTITDFLSEQQLDKTRFRDSATNIHMKISELVSKVSQNQGTQLAEPDLSSQLFSIQDHIVFLKRTISQDVVKWNGRLQEFVTHQQKKSRSQQKKEKESGQSEESAMEKSTKVASSDSIPSKTTATVSAGISTTSANFPSILVTSSASAAMDTLPGYNLAPQDDPALVKIQDEPLAVTSSSDSSSKHQLTTHTVSLATIPSSSSESSLSSSTMSAQPPSVTVTPVKAAECVEEVPSPDTSSQKHPASTSSFSVPPCHNAQSSPAFSAPPPPTGHEVEDSTEGWLQDLKGATRRWLFNSSFTPISQPFQANEHHNLPICERIPIVVHDNEPSSIIAYALSSSDYLFKLREIQTASKNVASDGVQQGSHNSKHTSRMDQGKVLMTSFDGHSDSGRKTKMLSFLRGNISTKNSRSNSQPTINVSLPSSATIVDSVRYVPTPDKEDTVSLKVDDLNSSTLEDDLASPEESSKLDGNSDQSPHIQLQFSDSTAKFYCRIYFADQFRKLRKTILPGNDNIFIRSLSRCKSWDAKGGKSGLAFSKTDDDRFILKQMSTMELDSFEKFGPQYFAYIKNCITEEQPTALAKILGVYRIGFRNSQTNTALRQDLLVMENLFYNKKIVQKFDLKGSIRNRLVSTAGRQAEEELVLMDENLLKSSVENPLYLRPHSKHVLKCAISSDTVFLSSNLVMDYSLLVGMVENSDDMVVGIIDYIRTFTWDKKLEMVFKSSGFLGGQGKMPTVVSPQLYRGRFLEAMDRYFLLVPDRWTGLGSDCPMKQNKSEESNQVLH